MGFKSDFWDSRARLNVAAYTNSYTDMQLSGTPLGIPLGASAGSSIENLGDSTINGLEVELTAQVQTTCVSTSQGPGWMRVSIVW